MKRFREYSVSPVAAAQALKEFGLSEAALVDLARKAAMYTPPNPVWRGNRRNGDMVFEMLREEITWVGRAGQYQAADLRTPEQRAADKKRTLEAIALHFPRQS